MPTSRATTARSASSRSADDLLLAARRSLAEASLAGTAGERYACAHLAGLRAAAAVLAARGRPSGGRRSRVLSVWVLLPQVAPELGEWATFFASGARKRAAAEAGIDVVSHREADDLVRDAESFVLRVCDLLGVPHQWTMAAPGASVLRHVG
jgi:hypothetical protein